MELADGTAKSSKRALGSGTPASTIWAATPRNILESAARLSLIGQPLTFPAFNGTPRREKQLSELMLSLLCEERSDGSE